MEKSEARWEFCRSVPPELFYAPERRKVNFSTLHQNFSTLAKLFYAPSVEKFWLLDVGRREHRDTSFGTGNHNTYDSIGFFFGNEYSTIAHWRKCFAKRDVPKQYRHNFHMREAETSRSP